MSDELREQAFQAGIRTRETTTKISKGAKGVKTKVAGAIEGTILNAQEGFKESSSAFAESTGNILFTGLANKNGFWRGVWCCFGFAVVGVGLWNIVPPLFSAGGHVIGGGVAGTLTGKPVNSDNGFARVSSYLGSGVNRVVLVGGQAIGEAASSAYQYQPVTTQQAPTGGSIRPGSINPFPQPPVVRVQMQQPQNQQPIAANQYNPNVYYQPRR